jgi:hypothetical protein
MAGMTDLAIRIATTMDATGINKADKSVKGLDKTIKKLGRTLGVTLGASAMAAYGKAAVKAFAEDEAAARRLSSAVDNLGLSFSKVQVATFISDLESSAAISDDILRPAFQSLLNVTGSLTKSQELLNNAIQISRASGVDLATVVTDLNKGYAGITRGLIKYNTGLTRAELTTKSFNEILGIMLAKSAGAAQDYLTTTSYKMDVLRVSSERAKESIGEGLINAFAVLGGGSQASDAAKTIDNIAKGINAITMATAQAINGLRQLYKGLDFLTSFGGITGGDGLLARTFDRQPTVSSGRSASPAGTAIRTRQQREAEAAAAKRAKEVANLTKKQVASTKALTAEQKKQNSLKKSATVFDMNQIELIAALRGKLSEEDRKRVEAQLALLNENDALAQKLTREILMAQDATGGLYQYFLSIGDAKIKNPFAFLDEWLINFQDKLNNLKLPTMTNVSQALAAAVAPTSGIVKGFTPPQGVYPTPSTKPFGPAIPATNMGTIPTGNFTYGQGNPLNTNVYVTVQGSVTTEDDLVKKIASGLQNQSLSTGDSAYINRRTGGFAG